MSLLEYDTKKKGRVDETTSQLDFEANDKGKKYEIEGIWDSTVYIKKSKDHLLRLYYLVLWKSYPEEENT